MCPVDFARHSPSFLKKREYDMVCGLWELEYGTTLTQVILIDKNIEF